eukprot:2250259-Rhodomonas_salina.2
MGYAYSENKALPADAYFLTWHYHHTRILDTALPPAFQTAGRNSYPTLWFDHQSFSDNSEISKLYTGIATTATSSTRVACGTMIPKTTELFGLMIPGYHRTDNEKPPVRKLAWYPSIGFHREEYQPGTLVQIYLILGYNKCEEYLGTRLLLLLVLLAMQCSKEFLEIPILKAYHSYPGYTHTCRGVTEPVDAYKTLI